MPRGERARVCRCFFWRGTFSAQKCKVLCVVELSTRPPPSRRRARSHPHYSTALLHRAPPTPTRHPGHGHADGRAGGPPAADVAYARGCDGALYALVRGTFDARSKVPRTRKHDRGRNALLRHLALRVKSVLLRRGELIDARARPIYTRSCARRLPRRRRRRCLSRCPRSRRSTRPPFIAPPDATTSATSTRHARGTVCDDARPSTRTPAPTGSHMATPTRTRPRRRPSPPQHTRTHTHSPTRRRRSRARVHRCPL